MSGMIRGISSLFSSRKKIVPDVLPPKEDAAPVVPVGTLWNHYVAPDFLQHGTDSENEYRQNAITAASSSGLNCIRLNASFGMSDELAIHLIALEHPQRAGYYNEQDNWYFKARSAGITRWIHDLGTPTVEQSKRWAYLTKSPYYKTSLQLVVSANTLRESVAQLKLAGSYAEVVVV